MVSRSSICLGGVVLFCVAIQALAAVDCISTPSDPSCSTYTLPISLINPNISNLCGMMDQMPGCTLDTICSRAGPSYITTSPYCDRFVILKTLCDDMEMGSCDGYHSMCRSGSVVAQCNSTLLPLPDTESVMTYDEALCNTLNATECKKCQDSSGSA